MLINIKKPLLSVLLSIFLFGCGRNEEKDHDRMGEKIQQLTAKRDTYLSLITKHRDKHGFIMSDECDSILFTGLVTATNALPVNLTAARDASGAWHRRPVENPCYPSGSASSISRDMFVGIFWHTWRNQRLDLATQIFQYGRDNDWIMGEGDASRIYMVPGLQGTLAEMKFRLGGTNHEVERNYPQVWGPTSDFESHLQVLHILLRGELTGFIDNTMLNSLSSHYSRNRLNPLFSYAYHRFTDGNQEETVDLLLSETYWPNSSLPTTENYCTDWLLQREYGPNWMPCPDDAKEHNGGDFLFVAGLVLGRPDLGLNLVILPPPPPNEEAPPEGSDDGHVDDGSDRHKKIHTHRRGKGHWKQ